MTTKSDFTPEEWKLIQEGPVTAGMILLASESGGTFRETFALAHAFTDARRKHYDMYDDVDSRDDWGGLCP